LNRQKDNLEFMAERGTRGLKLLGTYDSRVSIGQERVLAARTRIIFLDASATSAYVIQDARSSNSNTSAITQQDGSTAWVDQKSNYAANTATVTQAGAGNIVNVRQR
jgi:hypothetical protein